MKLLCTLILISLASMSHADDRDLYFAALNQESTNNTKPNILFVIDTSESMNRSAPGSHTSAYVPDYTYMSDPENGRFAQNAYWFTPKNQVDNYKNYKRTPDIRCDAIKNILLQNYIYEGPASIDAFNNINCAQPGTTTQYRIALGNYLNWLQLDGLNTGERTRIDVVKEAFTNLIKSLNGVNIGIMRFDEGYNNTMGRHGGAVIMAMQPVETVRDNAIQLVNDLNAKSYTPISETLEEARRYFYGSNPLYGKGTYNNVTTSKSISAALNTDGKYRSPITAACQMNHLVLFTDGSPTEDTSSNASIKNLFDLLIQQDPSLPAFPNTQNCSSDAGDGKCLDELTYYLRNGDASPLAGTQYITSHMIGGFLGGSATGFLQEAANAGGGDFYRADDPLQLATALQTIIDGIITLDSTFTAPAVSASNSNRLLHDNALYFSLFRPVNKTRWPGNLKKYQLNKDGILTGKNTSKPALDEKTGSFTATTSDLWNTSAQPDGQKTEAGGAASVILHDQSERVIFYNADDNTLKNIQDLDANQLSFSGSNADLEKLKQWMAGIDSNDSNGNDNTTDLRYPIADPLHSEPYIVSYENTPALIFFGDNEGYLHAINTKTGVEEYAFIPQALLKNQSLYMQNSAGYGSKPYGLDGLISMHMTTDKKKYLYAGMRRGGRDYYALDITERSAPKFLFKIEGGKDDFKQLGQTWAKAQPAKIKVNNEIIPVLIISGGYDPLNENNAAWHEDSMGNAIYIVDARTGTRLWWASNKDADFNHSALLNSIPASAALVSLNSEGLLDYFYVADTGGHIFRIDINKLAQNTREIGNVSLLASLGGDTSNGGFSGAENNRKFYTSPNVSFWPDASHGDFISLAIGSGLRETPRSTSVQDMFYVLRDKYPYPANQPPANNSPYARIYHQNIQQGNNEFINIGLPANQLDQPDYQTLLGAEKKQALTSKLQKADGWYLPLSKNSGEKVVSDALTFDGSIMFSTFSNKTLNNQNMCQVDLGLSQFYALDLLYGSATLDLDGDGLITLNDLKKDLRSGGLTPRPVVIFRENNKKTIAPGTETIEDTRYDDKNNDDGQGPGSGDRSASTLKKLYWREKM